MPRGNPSSVVGDGSQVVTTAGTRVQLTTTLNIHGNSTCVTALSTNTGIIVVGAVTCVAAASGRRGVALAAGQSVSYDCDPSMLWIDATVNGEGVSYGYTAR